MRFAKQLTSLLIVALLGCTGSGRVSLVNAAPPAHALPFSFTNYTYGQISKYNIPLQNGATGPAKNDLSGAAHIGDVNIVIDDILSIARMWRDGQDESVSGVSRPLHLTHRDLEGATQLNDQLIVTCSMTGFSLTTPNDPKLQELNRLSRYDIGLDENGAPTLLNPVSVNLRDKIMAAIGNTLGQEDPAWFARINLKGEKDGNLNIEGISATHPQSYHDLVWGVRGPLYGADFAKTVTDSKGVKTTLLDQGEAILVYVKDAFGDNPQFRVETINLQGKGVRSIEYIPSLQGYLIASGPVPKADEYRLWLYRPANGNGNGPSVLLDITNKLDGFASANQATTPRFLGRPEAIMNAGIKHVTFFSEADPTFTVQPVYNFIDVEVEMGRVNEHDDDA